MECNSLATCFAVCRIALFSTFFHCISASSRMMSPTMIWYHQHRQETKTLQQTIATAMRPMPTPRVALTSFGGCVGFEVTWWPGIRGVHSGSQSQGGKRDWNHDAVWQFLCKCSNQRHGLQSHCNLIRFIPFTTMQTDINWPWLPHTNLPTLCQSRICRPFLHRSPGPAPAQCPAEPRRGSDW